MLGARRLCSAAIRVLLRAAYALALLLTLALAFFWVRSHYRRDVVSRAWFVAWVQETALTVPPRPAQYCPSGFWQLLSDRGSLGLAWKRDFQVNVGNEPSPTPLPLTVQWNHDSTAPSGPGVPLLLGNPAWLGEWGFGYVHEASTGWAHHNAGTWEFWDQTWYLNIIVPYGVLALPLALSLVPWPLVYYVRRARRREPGRCPVCSYDLRAHSPGQKCPECGTPIATATPPVPPPTSRNPAESFPSFPPR